jgi:molybdate-binding protein/DNA-binding XRE family transcriptional regulator
MSRPEPVTNRVKEYRRLRGWSQGRLSEKAAISRAAVSAIEIGRLVPSVTSALSLAGVFGCSVESLFGLDRQPADAEAWAWPLTGDPCHFWLASVNGRRLRFPVENTVAGMLPHDAVWRRGKVQIDRNVHTPEATLVMASCDPLAGLLALEYERACGLRLLPLYRSSSAALELLRQGAVHIAGIHLGSTDNHMANPRAAKDVLGGGFSLWRFATWDQGLAMRPTLPTSSVNAVVRAGLRWMGREAGAGARQCQDEILAKRPTPRRLARDHRGVAEAIRSGQADVGVCLRLVSEQAGLRFIPVRQEAFDLCFPAALADDHRLKKLIELVRSPQLRALFSSFPGYKLSRTVEYRAI